jgi:hypothetical protein
LNCLKTWLSGMVVKIVRMYCTTSLWLFYIRRKFEVAFHYKFVWIAGLMVRTHRCGPQNCTVIFPNALSSLKSKKTLTTIFLQDSQLFHKHPFLNSPITWQLLSFSPCFQPIYKKFGKDALCLNLN